MRLRWIVLRAWVWRRCLRNTTVQESGAVVLRDEFNGALDTFNAALEVMRQADVQRRIVVFSDFSDSPKSNRQRAAHLGRMAAEVADLAGFIGERGEHSRNAALNAGMPEKNVFVFDDLSQATAFLASELRHGDLVLLKGRTNHHLSRAYLGLLGDVQCERESCALKILCDRCPRLGFAWNPELDGLMAPPESYA